MTAIIIFTRESTHDQSELDLYQSQVQQTFDGHLVKRLAAGTPQILEGPVTERTVVLQFPTKEAALQWYESSAYEAAKQHRFKGATYRVALIEGV